MKPKPTDDLSQFSMTELFRLEAETQLTVLAEGLMAVEAGADIARTLEALMRAAHSIKGAARVVGIDAAVQIAHAMEDIFVQAQQRQQALPRSLTDLMLRGVDLLQAIAFEQTPPLTEETIAAFLRECEMPPTAADPPPVESVAGPVNESRALPGEIAPRSFRVGSDNLDRLVALAGEARLILRRTDKFSREVMGLRKRQHSLGQTLQHFDRLADQYPGLAESVNRLRQEITATENESTLLANRLEEYSFQATSLGNRLYTEALGCRLRPFGDCGPALRRLTRDLSHSLEKPTQIEIRGESTEVDRDILEKLESVLTHLIRNALDHGIEPAKNRTVAGKPPEAQLIVEALHLGGRLVIRLSDDGRGVPVEVIRQEIVQRGLITAAAAENLEIAEVLEFVFLPGFSLARQVTEISGRGVGLDSVRVMARSLHGSVRLLTHEGRGTTVELSLPTSQSLVRCLLMLIDGVPCALPLARIEGVFALPTSAIGFTEGRQHCEWNGHRLGLINAAQVLEFADSEPLTDPLNVLVLTEAGQRFGVVVEKFLGEQELLLQPIDAQLGKWRDLSAAALLEDGTPVLVLDDEDFLTSIRNLAGDGSLRPSIPGAATIGNSAQRVLVVDDSLTVRELERKLLTARGYEVVTAIDGEDGWNTLREGRFDLILTDVDMPRLDGIGLVERIRSTPRFRDLPVMIVSYKDRPEDRQRGLEAGADYYLAKSSFHSDELARLVEELIGKAILA